MKRVVWLLPVALVAGCSGPDPAKALSEGERPQKVVVQYATEVSTPVTVPLLGAITASSRSSVGAEVDGRVVALLVKEGQRVKAGDALVQLSDDDAQALMHAAKGGLNQATLSAEADERIASAKLLQAKVDYERTKDRLTSDVTMAESRLAESQARYDQLKRGPRPQEIEAANADLVAAQLVVASNQATADFTKLILKRKSSLLAQGGIAQNDVDQAQLDYDHAVQAVHFAEQQLRAKQLYLNLLKEGTPREELAQGAAQLSAAKESLRAAKANLKGIDNAKQAVAVAEADHDRISSRLQQLRSGNLSDEGAKMEIAKGDLERTQIRTPIDGVVASIKVVKGQVAKAGQVIAEVVGQGGVRMEATAMDQDVNRVQSGQEVIVTLRDNPLKKYEGVVQQILPPGGEGRSSRILISVLGSEGLLPGAIAHGEVFTSETRKVVQIPLSSISSEIDGVADVFVVDGATVRRRPIQIAKRSSDSVTVVSGLALGDQVVIQPSKSLHDGSSVTVEVKR